MIDAKLKETTEPEQMRDLVTKIPERDLYSAEKEIFRLNTIIDILKKEDKRDPEDKPYCVLLIYNDGTKDFEMKTGRTELREYLKGMIEDIRIHDTKIIADGTPLEEIISVYTFIKHFEQFYEDAFDIEDYNSGENS